jgi:GT2 family glycosyltransferase
MLGPMPSNLGDAMSTLTRYTVADRHGEPSVRAVIVNYHTYDLLETCIRALQSGTLPPTEIVVVDNASDPHRLARLQQATPAVRAIPNARNVGYARACNQGWHDAATDFVLFVNPDVTVDAGCLAACAAAATLDPLTGIATCRLVRPDGRLDHACHRGLPTPGASLAYALRLDRLFPRSHTLARYTMSWLDPATDHVVEACSGAFMLVGRSLLESLGGWDERYWFYGEDLDLCLRAGQAGKRVHYVGTATAVHIKGASSHLHERKRDLTPAERAHRRRVQAAIVASHRLFFRQHVEPSSRRPVAYAIRAMFAAQSLRVSLAARLDGRT